MQKNSINDQSGISTSEFVLLMTIVCIGLLVFSSFQSESGAMWTKVFSMRLDHTMKFMSLPL